jgi:hypothetical protein
MQLSRRCPSQEKGTKMAVVKLKTKPYEVAEALRTLGRGLTVEVLEQVIKRGEIARDTCTKNDPPSTPGYNAWSTSVRVMRDLLTPLGWERNDDQNYSTVISPAKDVAIAIATGNDGTGDETQESNTKYPRGVATQAAVDMNAYLFTLLDPTPEEAAEANRATWIFLKKRVGDTVRAELSLPAAMTANGFVDHWDTRIILKPIPIDPAVMLEDDSTEDVDVQVIRKTQ